MNECPYGTIEMRIMPTCPKCGGDWPLDNSHRRDGHCPGRPTRCSECERQDGHKLDCSKRRETQ